MNRFITCAQDLVTSHEQTRAGFIEAALEKNKKAQPYIEVAKSLRVMAMTVNEPYELLSISDIRPCLLAAAGLSDKSIQYFTQADQDVAINELIRQFLLPAGNGFVDELVYRYLLTKGDSLGGSMRNYVGTLAKIKVTRKILSVLSTMGIQYLILMKDKKTRNDWQNMDYTEDYEAAEDVAAITWTYGGRSKVVFFDTKVTTVNKNIDICLYKGGRDEFDGGRIIRHNDKAIMFGELKGGIDPAGADEHWKTANSALQRIRTAFGDHGFTVKTSFVGAAIEAAMADEIWEQLTNGIMSNAANLTVDEQFTEYCKWIVEL